jgi:hypothetical protein
MWIEIRTNDSITRTVSPFDYVHGNKLFNRSEARQEVLEGGLFNDSAGLPISYVGIVCSIELTVWSSSIVSLTSI